MFHLIVKRILWMFPTLLVISVISFLLIQLPPGDYLTAYISALEETGETVDADLVDALRQRYNLDDPIYVQYWRWMRGLLKGNFGMSFEWNRPVSELIFERLFLTVTMSISTLVFVYTLAIPIGIYSAVNQYSLGDYTFTLIGFVGLAIPNFLFALILMFVSDALLGWIVGGLFLPSYQNAPWSMGKIVGLIAHLWIPVIVLGTTSTASLIRVVRGNLLDELRKIYVVTARAKGVPKVKLLLKYPVRVALNPVVSNISWVLPQIVSSSVITSVLLGIPTTELILLRSLMNQHMYLAGSMVMMLSLLTVVGTLISDLLLIWLDPRIRYDR